MTPTPVAEIAADLYETLQQQTTSIGQQIAIGRALHRAGIMALVTEDLPTQILQVYETAGANAEQFVSGTVQLLNTERRKLQQLRLTEPGGV